MTNITYCFTRDEGKSHEERIGHEGPHQVGLGLVFAGSDPDHDGRWVLRQAITLAEGYEDDRDDDITLVQPLLTRPGVRPYFVEVTNDEQAALRRLLFDAQDYWVVNNYASGEGDEDRLLGQWAEAGMVMAIGHCLDLKPVRMPQPNPKPERKATGGVLT
jgi:hypothetical protein